MLYPPPLFYRGGFFIFFLNVNFKVPPQGFRLLVVILYYEKTPPLYRDSFFLVLWE